MTEINIDVPFYEIGLLIEGSYVGFFDGMAHVHVEQGDPIEQACIVAITLEDCGWHSRRLLMRQPARDDRSRTAELYRMLVESIMDSYRIVIDEQLRCAARECRPGAMRDPNDEHRLCQREFI